MTPPRHPLLILAALMAATCPRAQSPASLPSRAPRFTTTLDFAYNVNAFAFVAGDVDRDGDVDFISPGGSTRTATGFLMTVHRNDGRGLFSLTSVVQPNGVQTRLVEPLADIDGDGDLDLVLGGFWHWFVPNQGRRSVVAINDGHGNFTVDQTRFPESLMARGGGELADFDRDGDIDVFFFGSGYVQNGSTWQTVPAWELWLNDGAGFFTDVTATHLPVIPPLPGARWYHTATSGDLNGDGYPDLIVAEYLDNGTRPKHVLLNDRSGRFLHTATIGPPTWTGRLRLGDVDGDGDLDLLACSDLINGLFLNDGRGSFLDASGQLPPMDQFTSDARFADFDLDGDLDLVVTSRIPPTLRTPSILVNDGRGVFTPVTDAIEFASLPGNSAYVSVADVDNDGDLDIMASWQSSLWSTGALFLNLHRHQLGPAYVPRGSTYPLQVDGPAGHQIALGLTTRPGSVSLGQLGRWGLDPATTVWLPPIPVPLDRSTSLSMRIPNLQSLAGTSLYSQGVELDPSVPALVHVTNWWRTVIQ